MRLHAFWITSLALFFTACSKQEPAAPAEPEAAADAVEAAAPAMRQPDPEFIEHMHAHAEFLDDLMFALADGDLDEAMTPAYWLAHHEGINDLPDEWVEYVIGMREAARAVERSPDIETARIRAEKITEQCQGCHAAAGIDKVAL